MIFARKKPEDLREWVETSKSGKTTVSCAEQHSTCFFILNFRLFGICTSVGVGSRPQGLPFLGWFVPEVPAECFHRHPVEANPHDPTLSALLLKCVKFFP